MLKKVKKKQVKVSLVIYLTQYKKFDHFNL